MLELPIPSIFVIERENGVLELIDGLQRTSSLIQFVNSTALGLDPLVLDGCDLIEELNGKTFEALPLSIKLRLKRTGIRTVIIKRQSSQFLRYEMFKRLNTGGSKLSEQDVRNVNARMIGDHGIKFYDFLINCANHAPYKATIDLLPSSAVEARADEELILRYFAAKNYRGSFKGNISDWLDGYMDAVLLEKVDFNFIEEFEVFNRLFTCLSNKFGAHAFVKYRNGSPIGGVAPAYYEAVTMGCLANLEQIELMAPAAARDILARAVESEDFRSATGPGANSIPKLEKRILTITNAFRT